MKKQEVYFVISSWKTKRRGGKMERKIVFEKYEVIRHLKETKEVTVTLVEHIKLHTKWIIKKVKKNDVMQIGEIEVLKKLHHPAIPRIVDIIEEDEYIYIIREFIEGKPMNEYMEIQGVFDEREAIRIGIRLCEILDYMHTNQETPIIYRDMKPSNIILRKDMIYVIDFGIARYYQSNSIEDTHYLGTVGFAAPEQFGYEQSDERTDIYGVGSTLYYMLTQKDLERPPYVHPPIRKIRKELTEAIEKILMRCMTVEKVNRYQTAIELKEELQQLIVLETHKIKSIFDQIDAKKYGFIGTRRGIGTSHIVLTIAEELHKQKVENSIIDCTKNQNLNSYANAYADIEFRKNSFLMKDIEIYENLFEKSITQTVINELEDKKQLLFDLGSVEKEEEMLQIINKMDFLDRIYIVTGAKPYEYTLLDEIVFEEPVANMLEEIIVILNHNTTEERNWLQENYKKVCFVSFPYIIRPFERTKDEEKQMEYFLRVSKLYDNPIKQKKRRKKEDIFSKDVKSEFQELTKKIEKKVGDIFDFT